MGKYTRLERAYIEARHDRESIDGTLEIKDWVTSWPSFFAQNHGYGRLRNEAGRMKTLPEHSSFVTPRVQHRRAQALADIRQLGGIDAVIRHVEQHAAQPGATATAAAAILQAPLAITTTFPTTQQLPTQLNVPQAINAHSAHQQPIFTPRTPLASTATNEVTSGIKDIVDDSEEEEDHKANANIAENILFRLFSSTNGERIEIPDDMILRSATIMRGMKERGPLKLVRDLLDAHMFDLINIARKRDESLREAEEIYLGILSPDRILQLEAIRSRFTEDRLLQALRSQIGHGKTRARLAGQGTYIH